MRPAAFARLAFAALAGALLAGPLAAQQDNACHLLQNRHVTVVGEEPNRVGYVSGPLLVTCDRGENLRSDSALVITSSHEVQLYGRVDFQDPTRALTSDYATYNSQTGRLYARGSVVFTDKERGSTLRGPELEYFRQMEGRPEAQMIAPGRPHLTLVPKAEPGKPRRDPMEVDGDRITTVGNRYMSSEGNVVIHGKDLNARSAEAFYDADQDRLELRRQANVIGPKYNLSGDFIETTMKDGKVQRVLARTDAHLVSDKLRVDGPLLTLFFADDKLQRLVAAPGTRGGPGAGTARPPVVPAGTVAPPPTAVASAPSTPTPTAGAPAVPPSAQKPAGSTSAAIAAAAAPAPAPRLADADRPIATANGFKMQADSLDALLPGQQLQTVTAVGRAHGESWDTTKVDSARARRPAAGLVRPARDSGRVVRPGGRAAPDSATVAAAVARVPMDRDIVDADTIVGHFVQVDTAHARTAPASRPTGTVRPGAVAAAAADTARPEPKTELDRMQAFGSAHALYRLRQKPDSARRDTAAVGRPGINYVIGDTIDLKMAAGEVSTAHVRGLQRGVYLDPSQPSAGDSASTAGATPPGVVVRPARTPAAPGGSVPATVPPRSGAPAAPTTRAKTPVRPEERR